MNDRKQRVLLTAQRLFVEKGFAATSVQDILDESHISKGTFYNYFSSKNECLMAILTHARDIATAKRRELLVGKKRSNKDILSMQISVRMEVNREYNLIPLFEAIFHSGDAELREFVKKSHMAELSWLSERLVDVYGADAAPYALDCAIMVLGMIQHFTNVWVGALKEDIDTNKLVHFVIRRTDSIVSNLIQTKEKLLGDGLFLHLKENMTQHTYTKEEILEKLLHFSKSIEDDCHSTEYIGFLIEEIQSNKPRVRLIETVVRSFCEVFADSPSELETRELALNIYNFLNTIEKSP